MDEVRREYFPFCPSDRRFDDLLTICHFLFSFIEGADARSTEVSVGCLASDSQVQLFDGKFISISHLKPSNRIRTIENNEIRWTEMILMMDKNSHQIGSMKLFFFFDINSMKLFLFFFLRSEILSFKNSIETRN